MSITTNGNVFGDLVNGGYFYGVDAFGPGNGSITITDGSVFAPTTQGDGVTLIAGFGGPRGTVTLADGGQLRTSAAATPEVVVGFGTDGSRGDLNMSSNAVVNVASQGLALAGFGVGGRGTATIDASTFTLASTGSNAVLSVAERSDAPSTGTLTLTNDARLELDGQSSAMFVGFGSRTDGTVEISGGSDLAIDGAGNDSALLVGLQGGAGSVAVSGVGSGVSVAGAVIVGDGNGSRSLPQSTFDLEDGANLSAVSVGVLDSGTLNLGDATVELEFVPDTPFSSTLVVEGGRLNVAGAATVVGDVSISRSFQSFEAGVLGFTVDAAGETGLLRIENGGLTVAGTGGTLVVDASAYTFEAGERLELIRIGGTQTVPLIGSDPVGGASRVTGQDRDFGYTFATTREGDQLVVALTALNTGTGTGEPVLRFGVDSATAASFSEFDGAGYGSGGVFEQVYAMGYSAVEGTDLGDVFRFDFATNSTDVRALGGDDLVSFDFFAPLGDAVLDGGTGVDTLDLSGVIESSISLGASIAGPSYLNFEIVRTSFGDDAIIGTEAAETFVEGGGSDSYDGGDGRDEVIYSGVSDLVVDLGAGTATHTGGEDTLTSIEVVTGSSNIDRMTGSNVRDTFFGLAGADRLEGGAGNDVLYGGAGNDILAGGDQNDILQGGAGSDILNGGRGLDFVSYAAATGAVTIDLVDASNNAGDAAGDRIVLIENAIGSELDDTIAGGNVRNVLVGRGGNDVIDGRGGADVVNGGLGADVLTGGQGFDTFQYRNGLDSVVRGADRITDFERRMDVVDLSRVDADTTVRGDQDFAFIGTAAFSGTAGELRYNRAGQNAAVIGDTDGDGRADFVIAFTGLTAFDADDFVL